jgi:tRNA dimethylallyltransferase
VVVVAGPTASGKSSVALELAEAFGGVIINADSMQVYRELRLLTARPTEADEARAPHRLYGVMAAIEPCSAGRWRALALAEIERARGAGKIAIVVGGTGLYLRALTEGLAPVPEVPAAVRAETTRLYERLGGERFRAALGQRDPVMAGRLEAGDRQRLIRAWEVMAASGTSLAEWQALMPEGDALEAPVTKLILSPPRQALYARCDARFAAMVSAGALEEVAALLALHLDPQLPVMKALGVRELALHLAGELTLDEAVAAGQQATRRYAKRQGTWFRNQMAEARVFDAQDSESIRAEIFPFIREFLLTTKS